MITKQELIEFEKDIEKCFLDKQIKAPIHLSDHNEDQVIWIFEHLYKSQSDWIFSTWRNHLHILCAGADPAWVKREILRGNSMGLCSKNPKLVTSAIVGGILPQAVGVAAALKRSGEKNSVLCLLGDMAGSIGTFHEAHKYSVCKDLPITFVIEDNGVSVGSKTEDCWGKDFWFSTERNFRPRSEPCMPFQLDSKTWYYRYEKSTFPHVGVLDFVTF